MFQRRIATITTLAPGPAWIALAALLWGTDSIFRYPLSRILDPGYSVLAEHLIAIAAIVTVAVAFGSRGQRVIRVRGISAMEWLGLAFVGAGASALATLAYTMSFTLINPSVAVLLQKLQPIVAVLAAQIFLGERPRLGFYFWAAIALGAGVILSFPSLDLGIEAEGGVVRGRGVMLACLAMTIWGVATVVGKSLLHRIPTETATFWRYVFGALALGVWAVLTERPLSPTSSPLAGSSVSSIVTNLVCLVYLSLAAGALPMNLYYRGLARTPASLATFIELLYPVSSLLLNAVVLGYRLDPMQTAAGALLLLATTRLQRKTVDFAVQLPKKS